MQTIKVLRDYNCQYYCQYNNNTTLSTLEFTRMIRMVSFLLLWLEEALISSFIMVILVQLSCLCLKENAKETISDK